MTRQNHTRARLQAARAYWLAALRRTAWLHASVALVCGAPMAAVLISEDGCAWPAALFQGTFVGLAAGTAVAVVGTASSTWGAVRAASRCGLTLTAEAVALPCTTQFRLPVPSGTSAYQLTDSVLHALKQIPAPRIDDVEEFTHGKLTLVCARSYGTPVRLRISIEKDRETATVTMEARPVSTWKRMDDGASWNVLTACEPHVRKAVHDEVGSSTR